jgi:hypothetical protein
LNLGPPEYKEASSEKNTSTENQSQNIWLYRLKYGLPPTNKQKTLIRVAFKVLTAVIMKSSIFWDIMPCSPLKVN